jgi:hypothetical protein
MATDNRNIAAHLADLDLTTPQTIRLPAAASAQSAVEAGRVTDVAEFQDTFSKAQQLSSAAMCDVFTAITPGMMAVKAAGGTLANSTIMQPLTSDGAYVLMYTIKPMVNGGPPKDNVTPDPLPGGVSCAVVVKPTKEAVVARKELLAKYRA